MRIKKIVWTNGCFDILHRGHMELFRWAHSLGDQLIVGVDSDEKVEKDKGPARPFNCLNDRMFMIESLRYVDKVISFNTRKELENLIKSIEPDILVVGSDWQNKEVVGRQYAKKVKFFNRVGNYSTTNILERKK